MLFILIFKPIEYDVPKVYSSLIIQNIVFD
jgi:hypothetical protein